MKSVCLLLLLLLTVSVTAQQTLSVPDILERAVKEKAPDWSLSFVNIRKNKEENNSYFRWKRGDQEVAVVVNEYESVAAAGITPQSLMTQAARKQEKINGLGDEAYLLTPAQYGSQRFDLVFRKGKVRVDVEAPSLAVAQQFARQLGDALPANK